MKTWSLSGWRGSSWLPSCTTLLLVELLPEVWCEGAGNGSLPSPLQRRIYTVVIWDGPIYIYFKWVHLSLRKRLLVILFFSFLPLGLQVPEAGFWENGRDVEGGYMQLLWGVGEGVKPLGPSRRGGGASCMKACRHPLLTNNVSLSVYSVFLW